MAHRPRVFLDVAIGPEPAGRLTIELFADKTPRTCENFRQLCAGEHNGLSYEGVPFHRVIDEFMIQGGDVAKGDGTGTTSIYQGEFDDENLEWRDLDAAGLVCSANRGPDTNGSQFFITLAECPHLNGKHTIFGRLVGGEDTLARIAQVAVDKNDRPLEPVLVSRCGELEKRKKPGQANSGTASSADRGRRRQSDQDAAEEEPPVSPLPTERRRRKRRESDNVVDEGIRGRPRLRSGTRSPSHPIDEDSESDGSEHSRAELHKRKREPSPSRHLDRRDEDASFERRRRSLPNQYQSSNEQSRRKEDGYRQGFRRDGFQESDNSARREGDTYRPSRDRYPTDGRLQDDGRLGSSGRDEQYPVKFKGRGVMKYRE